MEEVMSSEEQKIDALFQKLDKLTEKANEHEKWAAGISSKFEADLQHMIEQIKMIKEEQKISEKEIHVISESNNEERYKLKEELNKQINVKKDEASKEIEEAIKTANAYTNRGVAIAVGVITLIGVILAIVANTIQIVKSGGLH